MGVFLILPLVFSSFRESFIKSSRVERGFSNLSENFSVFNNHFFILLVIFVFFDFEVIISICLVCSQILNFYMLRLILFIIGTLFLEWFFYKLSWRD